MIKEIADAKLDDSFISKIKTNGADWNVVCYGFLTLDRETSTAVINKK
jgi:hypothetical protein